jgi:hypothetical protein
MYNTHNATHQCHACRSVSARRTAAYERPSYDSALPEEFFDSRVRLAIVCPETALMYAVLEDAFLCFQKQFETEQRSVRRAREAEDWFFSDDSRWFFSFVSVCHALGLEPKYLRTKLKHYPAWTQRRQQDSVSLARETPRLRDPTKNNRPSPLSK